MKIPGTKRSKGQELEECAYSPEKALCPIRLPSWLLFYKMVAQPREVSDLEPGNTD